MRILIAGLLLLATASARAEQSAADIEAQLKALEAEIETFREMLEKTDRQKSSIENNLQRNEEDINDILKRIRDIESELNEGQSRLDGMGRRQSELLARQASQQALIGRQLRAAYMMGDQEYLKVLLNQEDPNELSRMLTYYDYLNRARQGEIAQYQGTIDELQVLAVEITQTNDALRQTRTQLAADQQALIATRRDRRATLAALGEERQATGNELARLQASRTQLEQLLAHIERNAVNLPSLADAVPFARRKGDMPLPVAEGRVSQKFGSQRNAGKLRWQGMLIEAPAGTAVESIHYGRVVFSDWLRGFGLLIIINHGEGYMSLYGHNQVLYREAGDWVVAGEPIAAVGDSGGQEQTGLYFEIRVDGKPANPLLWCKSTSGQSA